MNYFKRRWHFSIYNHLDLEYKKSKFNRRLK
ncbi:hypothetical protein Ab1vBOLIVR5_gp212c [Agrobacterium phage OLIVR5]|uniref:Uncharacterized protein n=3 Tax=Caudoviricetes TaxID=2731619 RepID=A0A858MV68_9CAUD|nr:hypothetical protein KNU99_gp189 [Agrobacterium phage OLIVR5]QIW87860.1 hypothetical protein Ab1vBOLIVR5_gp212c [Agrobacterium phage OLIVR5]QIW88125.1 hypothetical protein Ab1vBOLIVR6_gp218c [Agrobacterium phage OLIVR6]